ncbi:hypothetical protein [uncultured Devosia sp.]|uniref:hypothetical protein n=1 Tax=uncultured Devosia sp. TaxID=211434 RepID=UPI0008687067|nr:hypothetical protein [uncultured Devosia sp.]ODS87413.1 MAG: hypothetical protein ABS47_12290 [Devosia sp. SCN 66-27]OJX23369.1 MAG: hypothetical protein BGO83_00330 [Devosia sp. 66-14]
MAQARHIGLHCLDERVRILGRQIHQVTAVLRQSADRRHHNSESDARSQHGPITHSFPYLVPATGNEVIFLGSGNYAMNRAEHLLRVADR